MKKPRCTKYVHDVQIQEGGATYQRKAELTLKHSVVGSVSPVSPAPSNRSVSTMNIVALTTSVVAVNYYVHL